MPPTLDSRVVYFIDRASGSNRQRLRYFIKTLFSSSTGHREYRQVRDSSKPSAEWVQCLRHNQGRENNNTNACICTLHSYFSTALRLVDEEIDKITSTQLSRAIVVFPNEVTQDLRWIRESVKSNNIITMPPPPWWWKEESKTRKVKQVMLCLLSHETWALLDFQTNLHETSRARMLLSYYGSLLSVVPSPN